MKKETRPNIVYIMNDHQAYYRHGWDGGVKPLTPNFDRLAEEGVRMENAYCATPLCGPVRRTILNGLYAHAHGNYYNDSFQPYEEESYLRILHGEGYQNYYYGKWHAGPGTPQSDHNCGGFSCEHYGNPYITETYTDYLKKRGLEKARHRIDYNFSPEGHDMFFAHMETGKEYVCESAWCGEHAAGLTVTPKETHESFFLANLACEKLDELAKRDNGQPFHLRLDFWGPHQPFFPTQEFLDLYNPEEIQVYGNHFDSLEDKPDVHRVDNNRQLSKNDQLILPSALDWSKWQEVLARAYAHQTMIDAAGGMVLDKLKELGLDQNTIVIWTTDHGDALASHGGHFDKCSYMSEEVMRIPMAIRWPGVIESGQTCNELVSNLDMPVTMLSAAGTKFTSPVHGMDLLPLVKGQVSEWRDGMMCETYGHGYTERILGRMYVKGGYKYVSFDGQMEELYHLESDPYEMENLANQQEYASIKRMMVEALMEEQKRFGDPYKLRQPEAV